MGWSLGTHAENRTNIGYVILIRPAATHLVQINDMYIKGFGTAQRHATTFGPTEFHREGRRVTNICWVCCWVCCRGRNRRHLFDGRRGSCSRRDQLAGAQWQLACPAIRRPRWRTRLAWQLQLWRRIRTRPFVVVGRHGAAGHSLARRSPLRLDPRPLTDIDLLADLIEQLQQRAILLVLELDAYGRLATRRAAGIEQNESANRKSREI